MSLTGTIIGILRRGMGRVIPVGSGRLRFVRGRLRLMVANIGIESRFLAHRVPAHPCGHRVFGPCRLARGLGFGVPLPPECLDPRQTRQRPLGPPHHRIGPHHQTVRVRRRCVRPAARGEAVQRGGVRGGILGGERRLRHVCRAEAGDLGDRGLVSALGGLGGVVGGWDRGAEGEEQVAVGRGWGLGVEYGHNWNISRTYANGKDCKAIGCRAPCGLPARHGRPTPVIPGRVPGTNRGTVPELTPGQTKPNPNPSSPHDDGTTRALTYHQASCETPSRLTRQAGTSSSCPSRPCLLPSC